MKSKFSSVIVSAAILCLWMCHSNKVAAKDYEYFMGTTVNDWNVVDYNPGFFDDNKFAENFSAMPENSWMKSTGSKYSESACGATHISKFTTDAGAAKGNPSDGIIYKFAKNKKNKKVTFSISDKNKSKDGTLNIAALIDGVWTPVASASTSGDENCTSFSVDLPDNAEAVIFYMLKETTDIYLGSVDITEDENQTLAVNMYDLSVRAATKTLTWKVGDESGIDHYDIEGSNDANQWSHVTTVQAENKSSYSVYIGEIAPQTAIMYGLLLLGIPLILIKRKKAGQLGIFILLLLGTGIAVSCSKDNDMAAGSSKETFKYYRVSSMHNGAKVEVSKVITMQ